MDRKILSALGLLMIAALLPANMALGRPSYFDANCRTCHVHHDDNRSCIGCHYHGRPRVALTDSYVYAPGSTITVTVGGAIESGWGRFLLYDQYGYEVDRVSGPSATGDDGTTSSLLQYPLAMTGKAPSTPGVYTWEVAAWGSPWTSVSPVAFPHAPTARVVTNSFTVLGGTGAPPTPAAEIKIVGVSPGLISVSPSDAYDSRSSGLDVVGINAHVYLIPQPSSTYAGSITDYEWAIIREPLPGTAVVDADTSSVFKFHPTVGGEYYVRLVPYMGDTPATPSIQRIYAARYVGTGTEGSNSPTLPMCGFSACHGNESSGPRNKLAGWQQTKHAHMLESFMNGERGSSYRTSCLPCHTLGYDTRAQGNANFYEVSQQLAFNLNQIPTWVADAATSGNPHWGDLPAPLQLKANIQCEHCHGPGSDHNGDSRKITGAKYDAESCRQCHDAPPHHARVEQWDNSGHVNTNEEHMATNPSCQKCHTGEGFICITVRGGASIPADITSRNPVNCVACHDSHDATNAHQLRTVAAVTLPGGAVYNGGLGNTCANCHNSRVTSPTVTINTSSRGAHHGPQAEVILATGVYDWGSPYSATRSIHSTATTDTCVTCHMAEAPEGTGAPLVGDHTFKISLDDGSSNAPNACGHCHAGLTTTDRPPTVPADYDGDGFTSGTQTEVGHLLLNVRVQILARFAGTSWDDNEKRISIGSSSWKVLTFNQRAALYNFNLLSEDKSVGIHNPRYFIGALQRSYYYVTGRRYSDDYPLATLVDPAWSPGAAPRRVVTGARHWSQYK
jgi:hypothetical protein